MTQPVRGAVRERDGDLVPLGLRASAAWTWRILLVAAGIYLLLRLLAEFKVLVVPVLVALLVVALIRPLAQFGTRRLGIPRPLASILTLLFVLLVLASLVTLVSQQVATGFPNLQKQSGQGLTDVRTWLANGPFHVTGEQIDTWIDQAQASLGANSSRLLTGALGVASTAADVGSGLFIALFSIFFFLATGDQIWGFVVSLFPRGARPGSRGLPSTRGRPSPPTSGRRSSSPRWTRSASAWAPRSSGCRWPSPSRCWCSSARSCRSSAPSSPASSPCSWPWSARASSSP